MSLRLTTAFWNYDRTQALVDGRVKVEGCELDIKKMDGQTGGFPVHILAGGDRTAWLGMQDSNSETSSQIIPLKGRTDLRESSRNWRQKLFALELRGWGGVTRA